MQTVAAQWLMLTLTSSAVYVTLVQTAAGLPVVLFAMVAGTIGDLVDRRRFLLITQAVMLLAAAALGLLAIAGLVTPWVLLALVWVKARGMSFYLVVFQGGSAVGSVAFGVAAQHIGLSPALLAAAAGLALGPLAGLRYRFQTISPAGAPCPPATGQHEPPAPPARPAGRCMVSVNTGHCPSARTNCSRHSRMPGSPGAAPEQVPGEPGRTAASPIGSWSG